MKAPALYVSHTTEKRQMKNAKDPSQTKTRWETQVTVLDENKKAVTLRMMDDEEPKLPAFTIMQPVFLELKVVRGDWDDSLGLAGIVPRNETEIAPTKKP